MTKRYTTQERGGGVGKCGNGEKWICGFCAMMEGSGLHYRRLGTTDFHKQVLREKHAAYQWMAPTLRFCHSQEAGQLTESLADRYAC